MYDGDKIKWHRLPSPPRWSRPAWQAASPFRQKWSGSGSQGSAHEHARQAPMKIIPFVGGLLSMAAGLFWFGQGAGLLSGPHTAMLIDVGAGAVALGIGVVWFALR
jgi:hypothetical protein